MKTPLITMSAITGAPTQPEIVRYLNSLKVNGIEQVMVYPRSGCELEYLSEKWFDTVACFIKEAAALDMNVWIYDEFNWPSGHAGGRVTAIEKYRLKSITTEGKDKGSIQCKSKHTNSLFNETFFPDLLSEEAVEYFIKCTHEKYYEKFGKYFGTVIKGMFTDEPSIGYACGENSIPYYQGIEDDYEKYCGRKFNEDLDSLHKDFYRNAYAVIAKQLRKSFSGKISKWCKEHGIHMTGHLMSDGDPFGGTKHNGNILKTLAEFSLPGIDEIRTDFRHPETLSILGIAEYVSGSNGAIAELFALGPVDMTYAKKRCMIYLMSCFKISHYFLAVSHMDMRGNMKIKDYFNNFTADQPDFVGTKLLGEEAKKAAKNALKDYFADVYIKYPTEICAEKITHDEFKETITFKFYELVNILTKHQIQWKFITSEEEPYGAPIISFTDEMNYTFKGNTYIEAEQLVQQIEHKIYVTNLKGEIVEGIFARKYYDGTLVVLNLYGNADTYLIEEKEVFLGEYGVYTSDNNIELGKLCELKFKPDFVVNYLNDNMIRLMYINDCKTAKIYTDSEKTVRFAVRNNVEALLENEKIAQSNDTESTLSNGMKELYYVSKNICLSEGATEILSSSDCKYLPSVFIIGDFKAKTHSGKICSVELCQRVKKYTTGDKIEDFGAIEFVSVVLVPENAKKIELSGTELYTEVFINDKLCGKGICAPYIFDIDEEFCGRKVDFKIKQYSSLGPIYGDVGYYDEHSDDVIWRGKSVPSVTRFGFSGIKWLI